MGKYSGKERWGGHRQNNYDLMRVFAMSMVVLNHVADFYFNMYLNNGWIPSKTVYIFEGVSHFAVPLFLMLTGAFVINKAGRYSAKQFYVRSLKKLGIPFLFFVIVYYVYDICNERIVLEQIWPSLYKGFGGVYAHWYVVMLALIYAFIPLIAFVKQRVVYKEYEKVCVIIFIWLMVSHYFESGETSWCLTQLYFMGYVLMGDIISNKLKEKSHNLLGITLIISTLIIMFINHSILYNVVLNGGDYYNKLLNLYGAPLIVIASLVAFCGFSLLRIKGDFSLIASASYIVFLCHKLLLNIIVDHTDIITRLDSVLRMNLKIIIPIECLVLIVISMGVALLINAILNKCVYKGL
ncbi:MAG: acyltransferase [Lachnospiraceae bacterium]